MSGSAASTLNALRNLRLSVPPEEGYFTYCDEKNAHYCFKTNSALPIDNDLVVATFLNDDSRWLKTTIQYAVPNPDNVVSHVIDFSFTSPSSQVLQTLTAGAVLFDMRILIEQSFDSGSTMSLGFSTDRSAVVRELPIEMEGTYGLDEIKPVASNDFFVLTLATGFTQGKGRVLYSVVQS